MGALCCAPTNSHRVYREIWVFSFSLKKPIRIRVPENGTIEDIATALAKRSNTFKSPDSIRFFLRDGDILKYNANIQRPGEHPLSRYTTIMEIEQTNWLCVDPGAASMRKFIENRCREKNMENTPLFTSVYVNASNQ